MIQRRMLIVVLATIAVQSRPAIAQQQPTLLPWTEVKGTVNNEYWGRFVLGITPTPNLPYRAAASSWYHTRFYRLDTPWDTTVQLTLRGDRPIVGDFNSDGYTDIVLGNHGYPNDTVFVYWGTSQGIDTLNPLQIPGLPKGNNLHPSCAGDLNGDGKLDLVLCAYGDSSDGYDAGRVYVFLNPVISESPDEVVDGDSIRARLGYSSTIGDVDADGHNELMVFGCNSPPSLPPGSKCQYVNIYHVRQGAGFGLERVDQLRAWGIGAGQVRCFDLNGDSTADLVWTVADSLTTSITWLNVHWGGTVFHDEPDLRIQDPGWPAFGYSLTEAGDMNGDGYTDLVVSSPAGYYSGNSFVWVFSGGPAMDGVFDAGVGIVGDSRFGESLSPIGDISGDGLADILVGAPDYEWGWSKGYWGIYKGDSRIALSVNDQNSNGLPSGFSLDEPYPNPFNPRTTIGYSVPGPGSALTRLSVYDALGKEVVILLEKRQGPGHYTLQFDGSTLASGVYFCRMKATTDEGIVYLRSARLVLTK